MLTIGAFEAKTHFSKILAKVGRGERVIITKNGKKIAMIQPIELEGKISVEDAFKMMETLSKKIGKTGITSKEIKEMKESGRS